MGLGGKSVSPKVSESESQYDFIVAEHFVQRFGCVRDVWRWMVCDEVDVAAAKRWVV